MGPAIARAHRQRYRRPPNVVLFVTPGDPRPDLPVVHPRSTVALVNIGLLALVAGLSFAYWLASGTALYWPTLVFAVWAGVVQFVLRRRPSQGARRHLRLRLENAAIGVLSALVLIATVVIPLTKLLPL
ncbi:hypothetical protein [Novosphingobium sp. JCM 18896]|uniref:hypothetical protein n=1 Tax=Novosphingobium sp. JCM 18896 TaxID=2989731 RepID=UPI002222C4DB|nr:hypothetical protein [Novosphingobium sp. JCM 18896]MCW1429933.1 hypothetical protein [Novosphingobium sp. JCM 18896]